MKQDKTEIQKATDRAYNALSKMLDLALREVVEGRVEMLDAIAIREAMKIVEGFKAHSEKMEYVIESEHSVRSH